MILKLLGCAVCALALVSANVLAADASTAAAPSFKIAFVGPLSNAPQAPIGTQVLQGAKLLVDQLNHHGGISGKPLELLSYDDQFKPAMTVTRVNHAIHTDGASAVMTVGTAPAIQVIAAGIPERARIPLFPLRTGAASVREPLNPFVFHIRAGYRAELQRLVQQLHLMGIKRFALLYQNDAFGEFGREVVRSEIRRLGVTLVGEADYERTSVDMVAPAAALGKTQPDALIMVAGGTQSVAFSKTYRQGGFQGQLVGLSDVDPQILIKEVGPDKARGIGVSQVFPSLSNRGIPIVREFLAAHQQFGPAGEPASLAAFEGYLSAKVIVEGMKQASLKRWSLVQALDMLGRFDMGGYVVSFSATQHEGSKYSDLLVIGPDGRVLY
jgi:branched-chain amino acid transport system substrate-binding protein